MRNIWKSCIIILLLCACEKVNNATLINSPTDTYVNTTTQIHTSGITNPFPTSIQIETLTSTKRDANSLIEGCNKIYLTNRILNRSKPMFTHDGKSIIFTSDYKKGDDYYLATMKTDGSKLLRIDLLMSGIANPQLSPTDDTIAIVEQIKDNQEYTYNIILISLDGTVLSHVSNNPTWIGKTIDEMQWSPNGEYIAFSTGGQMYSSSADIYLIKKDGTNLRRLTYPPAQYRSPRWSPDGKFLAYIALDRYGETYLEIVEVSSTIKRGLFAKVKIGYEITWSSDSKYIIYNSERDNNNEIYRYDIYENEEELIISSPYHDLEPINLGDENIIVFRSDRDGRFEIYTYDYVEKTMMKQVSNKSDEIISNMSWNPYNRSIYFCSSRGGGVCKLWSVELITNC